jgi:hypothetical protein
MFPSLYTLYIFCRKKMKKSLVVSIFIPNFMYNKKVNINPKKMENMEGMLKKIKDGVDKEETLNHLMRLFGNDDIETFVDWVYDNLLRLKMDGGYQFYSLLHLIEDVYTMFLADVYKWSEVEK